MLLSDKNRYHYKSYAYVKQKYNLKLLGGGGKKNPISNFKNNKNNQDDNNEDNQETDNNLNNNYDKAIEDGNEIID